MPKKNQKVNLGKSLIKDRFGPKPLRKNKDGESYLHTADLNDGYDWGRLNLQSVTEESSFQEFISTAELAGTEFRAEKLNIQFVNPNSGIGLLSKEEHKSVLESQEKNKSFLKIPRRPTWDKTTTAQELQAKEKDDFLNWRRQLVQLQESEELLLTPYEKNLEFWRQLWRVIERSDVIIQIVDARNPLLFRCEDLELYVKEINPTKKNMILLNKADFLTEEQRQTWADYFTGIGVSLAFFSATQAAENNGTIEEEDEEEEQETDDEVESNECYEEAESESELESNEDNSDYTSDSEYETAEEDADFIQNQETLEDKPIEANKETHVPDPEQDTPVLANSSKLLSRKELIELLKIVYNEKTFTEGITTIGLVGYPNVGKSSTINALMMEKKVSVSATPGKTKHFQTLFLDKDLLLCDCPGLVMPSFICTKAEMILHGILPIDQMKDHVPAITLLATLIPRHVIQDTYGIVIARPMEGEDPDRPPTSEEMLNAYGYNRGFMTQNGQPDNPRSSRYILKDFVNGKLLYCVAPPGHSQETFHTFPSSRGSLLSASEQNLPPRTIRAIEGSRYTSEELDRAFFRGNAQGVHVRGKGSILVNSKSNEPEMGSKPWKKINKHANKKKREKTRKLYIHLDKH